MTIPDAPADIVVISLAGVQRFTSESRTTADLSAASAIVARLSTEAAKACATALGARVALQVGRTRDDQDAPADPHHVPATPNRVVVRVPPRSSNARRGSFVRAAR